MFNAGSARVFDEYAPSVFFTEGHVRAVSGRMRRESFGRKALDAAEQQLAQPRVGTG